MKYFCTHTSPLGEITLVSEGEQITLLKLEGHRYFAEAVSDGVEAEAGLPILAHAAQWLDAYFGGKKPAIAALPLAPAGSTFRQAVWRMLCEIPYGQCTTYGEIARKMAQRMHKQSMSAQAVGGAVGHNPISIIIPCHRVVGSNGSLTGYGGGISRKIQLLQLEGVDTSAYFAPSKGTAL